MFVQKQTNKKYKSTSGKQNPQFHVIVLTGEIFFWDFILKNKKRIILIIYMICYFKCTCEQ